MDPLTHLAATALVVGRQPSALVAGLAPDLPFYVTYPPWWLLRGRKAKAQAADLPLPPAWLTQLHFASHSLLFFGVLVAVTWRRQDRYRLWLAWLFHLALDIPSHAKDRMAPRLFWPFFDWAHDGRSWSDEAYRAMRDAHNQKRRRLKRDGAQADDINPQGA